MVIGAEYEFGLLVVPNLLMRYARPYYFDADRADEDHTDTPLRFCSARNQGSAGTRRSSFEYGSSNKTCTASRNQVNVCNLATARGRAIARLLALGTSASINEGSGRGHSVQRRFPDEPVSSYIEGVRPALL